MAFDEEYRALHERAAWMDRSARDARLEVRGPDRVEWLHGLLTQDIKALSPGSGAYAAYLTPQGRMVADLRVFHRGETILLESAETARAQLLSRLDQFIIMEDVALSDATERVGVLTVCGPAAADLVSEHAGIDRTRLAGLQEHAHLSLDEPDAWVAASREFGVPAFDLFAPRARVAQWRNALQAAAPVLGDLTAETARIEAGRPRFGVDMHADTIPLEAGIESRAISFDKGCYVGQEIVIRILHRGQGRVARRLCWVQAAVVVSREETAAWTPGHEIRVEEKPVGSVTSACWSPARGSWLGIALLHRDATEPGTLVQIAGHDLRVERLP